MCIFDKFPGELLLRVGERHLSRHPSDQVLSERKEREGTFCVWGRKGPLCCWTQTNERWGRTEDVGNLSPKSLSVITITWGPCRIQIRLCPQQSWSGSRSLYFFLRNSHEILTHNKIQNPQTQVKLNNIHKLFMGKQFLAVPQSRILKNPPEFLRLKYQCIDKCPFIVNYLCRRLLSCKLLKTFFKDNKN